MANRDMYFLEPYSIHQTLTLDSAFRNYFQEAIKTNDTYLGNVIVVKAAANILSGAREAVIAVEILAARCTSAVDEVYYVIEGNGFIKLNGKDHEIRQGTYFCL
jgi:mannose-6-phosphate isomerase-like protein (cupin superfamily)